MTSRADPADALLVSIVQVLRARLPEVPPAVIIRASLSVASTQNALWFLDRNIKRQLNALHGEAAGGVQVQKLIVALQTAGVSQVRLAPCSGCARRTILKHPDKAGGRLCSACFKHTRATICSTCGHVRPAQRVLGAERICKQCWRRDPRAFRRCTDCGRWALPGLIHETETVCTSCYRAPKSDCAWCGRNDRVAKRLDGRATCPACYAAMRRPRPCPTCGEREMLANFSNGILVCAACAQEPPPYACPSCGSTRVARVGAECADCRRPEVVARLLTAPDGHIPASLEPLRDYLLACDWDSTHLRNWIHRGSSARVVRRIAHGEIALSYEAILNAANSPWVATFTLELLVRAHVIEPREIDEVRYMEWERTWLNQIESQTDRTLLTRYARWEIRRGLQEPRPRSGDKQARYGRARTRLKLALTTLEEVRARGYTVDSLPQRELDEMITGAPTRRSSVIHFLRWLNRSGHFHLWTEYPRQLEPSSTLSQERHAALVLRVATDASIEPRTRLAAMLTLLYGVPGSRIVQLRWADLTMDPTVTLTLGSTPLRLESPVAELVSEMSRSRTESPRQEEWIFPGRLEGTSICGATLRAWLRPLGIQLREVRSAVMLELARAAPAVVVSDLLDVSLSTATRWATAGSRSWSE